MLEQQPQGILYIILDNARYYHSQIVQNYLSQNKRIQFVHMPPYSPNLNLIERLWKFFKRNITYNRYYEEFAVFREKCLEFLQHISDYKEQLKNLMTENFQVLQAA